MSGIAGLLVGGAIGFLSAVLAPMVTRLVARPVLKVFYDEIRGCREPVPARDESSGAVVNTIYFHIGVENRNWTRRLARNCRAYLVRLEGDLEGRRVQYWSSIPLAVSYGEGESAATIDVPHGLTAFFNVVVTQECNTGFLLGSASGKTPNRYIPVLQKAQSLTVTILVAAEDANPKKIRLKAEWNGAWDKATCTKL
jgi:hypothetical protein